MQNLLFYGKKYGKDIFFLILLLVCLTLLVYQSFFKNNNQEEEITDIAITDLEPTESLTEIPEEESIQTVYVDIKGAVKNPGVYSLAVTSIINDAITASGGFLASAYQDGINLSKKVSDEMVIYVYTKNEIKKYQEQNSITEEEIITNPSNICLAQDYDITECLENKESIIIPKTYQDSKEKEDVKTSTDIVESNKQTSNEESKLININTASIEELTTLSGIGESKAKAIISYRSDVTPFTDITDIMNVSGIGEAIFAKIKDYITV